MGKTIYKLFMEVFGDFISENGFKKIVVNDVYSKSKFNIYYKFDEEHKLLKSFGYHISRGSETGWKAFDIIIGNDPLLRDLEDTNIFGGMSLSEYCRIGLKRRKVIPESFPGYSYSLWEFRKDNDEETLYQLHDAYQAFVEQGKEYLLSNTFVEARRGFKKFLLSYEINPESIDYAVFAGDKKEALRVADNIIKANEAAKEDLKRIIETLVQSPNYINKNSWEYKSVQNNLDYLSILNNRLIENHNLKLKIENEFSKMQKQLHLNIDKNIKLIKNTIKK
ncbi:MAG: hypothetical protein JXB08_06360 [Bacilli bacterium]|nr:hypothetical protein [Bacilli bacterium]MBN2795212.1 hypothetical protein [Clostridia bacterium]